MAQLQPQDLVLAIHLLTEDSPWTFQSASESLGISASQVHAAWKRLLKSKLADPEFKKVIKRNLLEFLCYGAKYCFPATIKGVGKGVPTGHTHPKLRKLLLTGDSDQYVWPSTKGKVKGIEVDPLHKSAVNLSQCNAKAYEILAAFDSLRSGKSREQEIAISLLKDWIK